MGLQATLTVEADEDAVGFLLRVGNDGDDDVDLTFSDGQRVDVVVRDGDRTVWRFAEGRMFTQALGSDTVPAGGEVTYGAEWPDPDPGDYEAEATLAANGAEVAATATFSV
jgi:hypothetical protein